MGEVPYANVLNLNMRNSKHDPWNDLLFLSDVLQNHFTIIKFSFEEQKDGKTNISDDSIHHLKMCH